MATDDVTSLPPREALEERLDSVRDQVFRAQGICGLAAKAAKELAETKDRGDHTRIATDAWCALESAHAILESVATDLFPDTLLDRNVLYRFPPSRTSARDEANEGAGA